MAKNKNMVKSIILIVLGVLGIVAFFLPFWKLTASSGSYSESETLKIFGKKDGSTIEDYLEMMNKDSAKFPFKMAKILGIVAIILGIAVAVFEVLKFANIDLASIEKIVAIVLLAVTVLFILFSIVFFCGSTSEMKAMGVTAKGFFSTAIGFYFVAIPGIASGILAIKQ